MYYAYMTRVQASYGKAVAPKDNLANVYYAYTTRVQASRQGRGTQAKPANAHTRHGSKPVEPRGHLANARHDTGRNRGTRRQSQSEATKFNLLHLQWR